MTSSIIRQISVAQRAAGFGAAILSLLASVSLASGPVFVSPVDTHTEEDKPRFRVDGRPDRFKKSFDAVYDNHAPHHPANLIHGATINRVVDRLRELKAKEGVAGPSGKEYKESKDVPPPEDSLNLSIYGEYSYLTSNDKRQLDTDSITNAGSGGVDLTLGNTLVGLIYYYSHMSMASDFLGSNTSSDSNFISLYVAHPIQPWLSLGLTGGYGHTDVEVNLRRRNNRPPTRQSSDTDSWTASPFLSASYASGNFYASLTTTYQYLHTDTDDSGQLNVQVATGYQFADWLSGEINGKFSQMLHNTRGGVPEDDNWFGVGAKLKQYITPNFTLYEAYNFNANDTFEEHMFTGGLAYSF